MKHTRMSSSLTTAGPMHSGWLKKSAPSRRDGEVRVRVLAAGVALPDVMMREGIRPETPPAALHARVGI